MTTSRKREVVETGIVDVLNYVRRFNHLKLTSYKYVFVVPSDIASEYHNNKAKLVPLKTKLGGDAIEWPTGDLSFSQKQKYAYSNSHQHCWRVSTCFTCVLSKGTVICCKILSDPKMTPFATKGMTLLSPVWQQQLQQQLLSTAVDSHNSDSTVGTTGMTLLSPVWQQQLQQQLLSTAVDSHNSDSTVGTTVPLQLQGLHYTGNCAKATEDERYTQRTSSGYTASATEHTGQSYYWCVIRAPGTLAVKTATAPVSACDHRLVTTAVVPIQASLSMDVLTSAIKLLEKQNRAEMSLSDVIGAIIDLHCGLHAEQYCTDKAKQSKVITLALLAYYALYFIEPLYNSHTDKAADNNSRTYMKTSPMKVCWEFVEVIIAWCKLTTAASGWAVASTVILVPAHVQSQTVSINTTAITAVVLLLMSLVNQLHVHKQAAAYCSSLFHHIPLMKAWLETLATTYIACKEVLSILLHSDTAVAQYQQARYFWLDMSSSSCSSEDINVVLKQHTSSGVYWQVGIAASPCVIIRFMVLGDMLAKISCIRINAKTSTFKGREMAAAASIYATFKLYCREGSALKTCAINAYLQQNCYIQVLQQLAVNKHTSAVAKAANESTSTGIADHTRSSIDCSDSVTAVQLNRIQADRKRPQCSIGRTLQLIDKALFKHRLITTISSDSRNSNCSSSSCDDNGQVLSYLRVGVCDSSDHSSSINVRGTR
eukprot:7943-Heterococcus_DN1.PRE.2